MKKRRQIVGTMTGVLAAGVVIASVLLGTGSRTSANGARHFNCTNATLEGRYAVIGGGFIPGGAPPAPLIPSVHMSLMTLDGAGSLIDKVTVSDGGQVQREDAQGTYTDNADCRGDLTIPIPGPPFQLTWDLVVADLEGAAQGKEFYAIGTVPGAASTFTAKRIQ
jgi:hypothetical protein